MQSVMYKPPYQCPSCKIDPENHSLKKLIEKYEPAIRTNIEYYYTCPAQAKLYYDTQGILDHYDGVLREIPKENKWVWIFDSKDFGLRHFMQIQVGIGLAKLISTKYGDNLNKIIIINPNYYTSITYNVVKYFLSEYVNSIIEFDYETTNVKHLISKLK
jgi:hypothetical protein